MRFAEPIHTWNGRRVSAVEPEIKRYTGYAFDQIRQRQSVLSGEPVLLVAHYLADDTLTAESRAPCLAPDSDCRFYVVILGGTLDVRTIFIGALTPDSSGPIVVDHIAFFYEFDGRDELVSSGYQTVADASELWPLINAVRSSEADGA